MMSRSVPRSFVSRLRRAAGTAALALVAAAAMAVFSVSPAAPSADGDLLAPEAASAWCATSPRLNGWASESNGAVVGQTTVSGWYFGRVSSVDAKWNCTGTYKYDGVAIRGTGGGATEVNWGLLSNNTACDWIVGSNDYLHANNGPCSPGDTVSRLKFDLNAEGVYRNDTSGGMTWGNGGDMLFTHIECSTNYGARMTNGTANPGANCGPRYEDLFNNGQTITYDRTAPTSNGISAGNTSSGTINVSFNISDAVSGLSSARIYYLNGSWVQCNSSTISGGNYAATWGCAVPWDGLWTLGVQATDNLGNVGGIWSTTATRDSTAPTSNGISASNTTSGTINVSFNVSDATIGLSSARVYYNLNGSWVQCASSGISGGNYAATWGCAVPWDATWTLGFDATDNFGNYSGIIGTTTATRDSTAPTSNGISASNTTSGTISVSFGVADATIGLSSARVYYNLNGSWVQCASSGISGGNYAATWGCAVPWDETWTLGFDATDNFGNYSGIIGTTTAGSDRAGPSTPAVTYPTSTVYTGATSGTVTWSASTDNYSGVNRYEVNYHWATLSNGSCVSQGADSGWQSVGNTTSWVPVWGSNTCFQFQVRAVDNWGNLGSGSGWPAWWIQSDQIAPNAPTVTVTGTGSYQTGTTVWRKPPTTGTTVLSATVTGTDAGSGIASNSISTWAVGPSYPNASLAGNPVTFPLTFSPSTVDGTLRARSTDRVGLVGPDSAVYSFQSDSTPPALVWTNPTSDSWRWSTVNTFTWTEADSQSGVGTRTAQLTTAPLTNGSCGTTYSPSGPSATAAAGTWAGTLPSGFCYRLEVTLSDRVGNQFVSTSPALRVDTTAPSAPTVVGAGSGVYQSVPNAEVWFNASAAGSLTLTSTAADSQSGITSIRNQVGYAQVIDATPDLVAYYRLGETSGTVALDSAGPNNGTYTGAYTLNTAPAVATDGNRAATMTGGLVTIGAPVLTATDNFSIEGWFNWTGVYSAAAGEYMIVEIGAGDGYGLAINPDNGRLMGLYEGVAWMDTGVVPTSSAWHHIALVRASGTTRIYLDGAQAGPTWASTPIAATVNTAIGGSPDYPGQPRRKFAGSVDEVAFYTRGLSAAEISAHYAARTGTVSYSTPFPVAGSSSPLVNVIPWTMATANASVSARAINGSGLASLPTSVAVLSDGAAPITTLVQVGTTSTTVTLTATDSGSGVASTWYTIDGGSATLYTGPFVLSGPPGDHSITYYSTDRVGIREVTKWLPGAPSVSAANTASVYQSAANGPIWFRPSANASVDLTAVAGADGPIAVLSSIRFEALTPAGTWTPSPGLTNTDLGAPYQQSLGFTATTAAATIRVVARYSDGSESVARVLTLTPDSSAPVTTPPPVCALAGLAGWCRQAVTFAFSVSDGAGVGSVITKFRDSTDGIWQSGRSGSLATDGAARVLTYYSEDMVGNRETDDNVHSFDIDTVAPAGELTLGAAVTTSRIITATATMTDATSGPGSVRFTTDGGYTWTAWIDYLGVPISQALTLASGSGHYEVSAQIRDKAGNETLLGASVELSSPLAPPTIGASAMVWECDATDQPYVLNSSGTIYWPVDRPICLIPTARTLVDGTDQTGLPTLTGKVVNFTLTGETAAAYPSFDYLLLPKATETLPYFDPSVAAPAVNIWNLYDPGATWSGLRFKFLHETSALSSQIPYVTVSYQVRAIIEWRDPANALIRTETLVSRLDLRIVVKNSGTTGSQ